MTKAVLQEQHLSTFDNPIQDTLDCITRKNTKEEATLCYPTKYISTEAAAVAKLLSYHIGRKTSSRFVYRTFFSNSHLEAVIGTIKIMRHNFYLDNQTASGTIAIYDPEKSFQSFFNPLDSSGTKEFIPDLLFYSNPYEMENEIQNNPNIFGFIFCIQDASEVEILDILIRRAKEKKIYTGVSEGYVADWHVESPTLSLKLSPDVYIFGENTVRRQIPFGGFSMTREFYKPWNTIDTCLAHSSSFSGNTLSLSLFLFFGEKYKIEGCKINFHSDRYRFNTYRTYVNPTIGLIFEKLSLSPKILSARGSKIHFSKIGATTDGVGGSGCSLRGHNPKDIPDLIDKYDPASDYFNKLESLLTSLSSIPNFFQATSGSSAVDIALILTLLALGKPKTLITFTENYSGKTLGALNFTRFTEFQKYFTPLYHDVVEINPFTEEGVSQLEFLFENRDIGLIWFEIMQGESLKMIPETVLKLIMDYRRKKHFFIGVDEILTGMFRTGSFLLYQQTKLIPDIVCIGKGMSDMTIPTAGVLVTEELIKSAKTTNSDLVTKLKNYYKNQLAACITYNAIQSALANDVNKHVQKAEEIFKSTMSPWVKKSWLVSEIRGKGLLLYQKLDHKRFPISLFGEYACEFIISAYCLQKSKLIFLNSRITPALNISHKSIEDLAVSIQKNLDKLTPAKLTFLSFLNIMRVYFAFYKQKILQRVFHK